MTTIGEVLPPEHVAVIMDGNGRWAKKRGFPPTEGHRQGLMTARKLVQNCISKKIPQLTLFAFSQENFNRPPQEVNALLQIFSEAVSAWQQELKKKRRAPQVYWRVGTLPQSFALADEFFTKPNKNRTKYLIGGGGRLQRTLGYFASRPPHRR